MLIEDEEFQRYFTMKTVQIDHNPKEDLSPSHASIIRCTKDNFKANEEQFQVAKEGVENSLFCPADMDSLYLRN